MKKENIVPFNDKNIRSLFDNIKNAIEKSREHIFKNVNSPLVLLYWNIGKMIKENIMLNKRAEYGNELIKNIGKSLTTEYGTGFSEGNLSRMVKFYTLFSDEKILVTLSQEFTWSHFVEFIRIDNTLKREFYITMCSNEYWGVRTLRERINSMLFERTAISKKPEETIKNDLQKLSKEKTMNKSLFLRDPYILDFLELKEIYDEKDLENAILVELERFILEFGSDFAFLARQKRIQIGEKDFYLDLLFYHRKMRRLVLIELKIGEFEPENKGQVELYLKWLSKYEKQKTEEEPIAIILCSGKDSEVIELMELNQENIHISEYWLELPPRKILEEKLHKAIENAKRRIETTND